MTNSLAYDVYSRGGELADNLNTMGVSDADVDDGLRTLVSKVLDIPNKNPTTLTIDVPLNLEYGDDFNITGSLTSGSDGVSNATIKLKVGSTVVDTDTTDGTGSVSFTQCPVATGTHSFQLIFDGDIQYSSSESSVVIRDVAKETSVITLNYPTASSNHYTSEAITVSGVFTDNDNTAIAGATLSIKVDSTTVKTVETANDGSFSDSITIASSGSKTVSVEYATTTYYTASSVSRFITLISPSLTVTSNKSILSYADHESATLSATLSAGDKAGKTISFDLVDSQGTFISNIGTGTTDSGGYATCDTAYASTGAGDIYIQASYGIFLSETYSIEDIYYYDALTSNKGHWNNLDSSNLSYSFGNDGMLVQGLGASRDSKLHLDITYPNDYEVELTVVEGNNNYTAKLQTEGVAIESMGNILYFMTLGGSNNRENGKLNLNDKIKFVAQGTDVKLYLNNVLKRTVTRNNSYSGFEVWGYESRSIKIKDLTIKEL